MSSIEVKEKIDCESPDAVFDYKGKRCGITSIYENGEQRYEAGYGDKSKTYHKIDELMTDPFYDGKSLNELIDEKLIEIDWY